MSQHLDAVCMTDATRSHERGGFVAWRQHDSSSIGAKSFDCKQADATTNRTAGVLSSGCCTVESGRNTTELFPRGSRCITRTTTGPTTKSAIWSCAKSLRTVQLTCDNGGAILTWRSDSRSLLRAPTWPRRRGMHRPKASLGIARTQNGNGAIRESLSARACIVGARSRVRTATLVIARKYAAATHAGKVATITRSGAPAFGVKRHSWLFPAVRQLVARVAVPTKRGAKRNAADRFALVPGIKGIV